MYENSSHIRSQYICLLLLFSASVTLDKSSPSLTVKDLALLGTKIFFSQSIVRRVWNLKGQKSYSKGFIMSGVAERIKSKENVANISSTSFVSKNLPSSGNLKIQKIYFKLKLIWEWLCNYLSVWMTFRILLCCSAFGN